MPSTCHFRMINLGKKLSSFVTAPPIHDTQMMDKLTNSELNRLILKEHQPANKDKLGYLLTYIFQSFTTEIPAAEELAIPLSSVPQSARLDGLCTFSVEPDGVPMINLYDTEKHWEQKGVESDKGEWILVDEAATNAENLSESILSGGEGSLDDQMPSSNSESSLDSSNDGNEAMASEEDFNQSLTEHIFGSFFNVISVALLGKQLELAQKNHLSCNWSTANSSRPVHGEDIKCKPDLALLDNVEA
ncbi:hypothetical protein BDR06DRAFT_1010527 [Suillus hirtellus]|nr:hypothetical protein BDR06DRAFT_1010527 [Suillus hirtellus]